MPKPSQVSGVDFWIHIGYNSLDASHISKGKSGPQMQPLTESALRRLEAGKYVGFARGILARKKKDGSVTVVLQKRLPGSNAKSSPPKHRIGVWPDSSLNDIELKAAEFRQLIDKGVLPKDQEKALKKAQEEEHAAKVKNAVTLMHLLEQYERSREIAEKGIAPSTKRDRRQTICLVFEEWLDKPIQLLTKEILENKFYEWSSQRGAREQAKKAIRYLRSLLNYAINMHEYIEKNPCDAFKSNISTSSTQNEEFLHQRETQELFDWIERLTNPGTKGAFVMEPFGFHPSEVSDRRDYMYQAVRLLLLTGLRRRELLQLRWDNVYLDEKEWREQNTEGPYFWIITSKQKQPFGVPITPAMMSSFRYLERKNKKKKNGFVFPSPAPGEKGEAPLDNERGAYPSLIKLIKPMKWVKKQRLTAQLLRKTFATTAYAIGYSLDQIDLYTGHQGRFKSRKVATHAYVTVQADNHRLGFEKISDALVGLQEVPDEAYYEILDDDEEAGEAFEVVPGGYSSVKN